MSSEAGPDWRWNQRRKTIYFLIILICWEPVTVTDTGQLITFSPGWWSLAGKMVVRLAYNGPGRQPRQTLSNSTCCFQLYTQTNSQSHRIEHFYHWISSKRNTEMPLQSKSTDEEGRCFKKLSTDMTLLNCFVLELQPDVSRLSLHNLVPISLHD